MIQVKVRREHRLKQKEKIPINGASDVTSFTIRCNDLIQI